MSGWKTYLCASAAVVVLGMRAAGQAGMIPQLALIPDGIYEFVLYLLGFGGLAALRSAIGQVASVPFGQPAQLPAQSEPELPRSLE